MSWRDKTNTEIDIPKQHLLETLHIIRESSDGENYPSKLSEKTSVSGTSISNRADELEDKGLIKQINKGNNKSKTFLELTEKGKKVYRKAIPFISDHNLEEEIEKFKSLFKRKPTKKELENRLGTRISEEELLSLEEYNEPSKKAIDRADQLVKYLLIGEIHKKLLAMEKSKNRDCKIISQERKETRAQFNEHNLQNEISRINNLGDEKSIDLSLEDFNIEENSISKVEEEKYEAEHIDTKLKTKTVCVEMPEPWKSYFASKEGIKDFYFVISYKNNINKLIAEAREHNMFKNNLKLFLDKYLPWREQEPIRLL